jgi:hypothetical protein
MTALHSWSVELAGAAPSWLWSVGWKAALLCAAALLWLAGACWMVARWVAAVVTLRRLLSLLAPSARLVDRGRSAPAARAGDRRPRLAVAGHDAAAICPAACRCGGAVLGAGGRGDRDVLLDLQTAFTMTYDRAGYDYSLDYADSVRPELSMEDAQWLRSRLTK